MLHEHCPMYKMLTALQLLHILHMPHVDNSSCSCQHVAIHDHLKSCKLDISLCHNSFRLASCNALCRLVTMNARRQETFSVKVIIVVPAPPSKQ